MQCHVMPRRRAQLCTASLTNSGPVTANALGHGAALAQSFQHSGDVRSAEARRHFDAQALARAVVEHVEQSELPPTAERVVHEVQRPALVATTWQAAARRAAQSVAAIASTSADAALIAIQGIHAIGTDSLAPRQEERAQPSVAKVRPQRFGLLGDELTQ